MPLLDDTATHRRATLVAALAVTLVVNPFMKPGTDTEVYQTDLEHHVHEPLVAPTTTQMAEAAPIDFPLLFSIVPDNYNMQSNFALPVTIFPLLTVELVSQGSSSPNVDTIVLHREFNETGRERTQHAAEVDHCRGDARMLWL